MNRAIPQIIVHVFHELVPECYQEWVNGARIGEIGVYFRELSFPMHGFTGILSSRLSPEMRNEEPWPGILFSEKTKGTEVSPLRLPGDKNH
jgi:hypothetical protein